MYRILAHARPVIAGRIQEKNESSHHDKWMNEWMLMSKRAIKASFKNRKISRKITPNFKQIERISSLQKRWYTFFEKQMTVYITWWQVTKLQERVNFRESKNKIQWNFRKGLNKKPLGKGKNEKANGIWKSDDTLDNDKKPWRKMFVSSSQTLSRE